MPCWCDMDVQFGFWDDLRFSQSYIVFKHSCRTWAMVDLPIKNGGFSIVFCKSLPEAIWWTSPFVKTSIESMAGARSNVIAGTNNDCGRSVRSMAGPGTLESCENRQSLLGFPSVFMGFPGFSRVFHGFSRVFHGFSISFPWFSMVFHSFSMGFPWDSPQILRFNDPTASEFWWIVRIEAETTFSDALKFFPHHWQRASSLERFNNDDDNSSS